MLKADIEMRSKINIINLKNLKILMKMQNKIFKRIIDKMMKISQAMTWLKHFMKKLLVFMKA